MRVERQFVCVEREVCVCHRRCVSGVRLCAPLRKGVCGACDSASSCAGVLVYREGVQQKGLVLPRPRLCLCPLDTEVHVRVVYACLGRAEPFEMMEIEQRRDALGPAEAEPVFVFVCERAGMHLDRCTAKSSAIRMCGYRVVPEHLES